ncbi:MAG TPA: SRPBCC family protein [Actinomycetota bacterium]|nr:SRPBCC family protein [Actinomycetota bacterium]
MKDLVQTIVVEREPGAVFALISDPDTYPEFFTGLTKWRLLSDRTGLGARYRVLMKVGSIEAGGIVQVTYWREPEAIRWRWETGIRQEGAWELREVPSGTEVELRVGFDLSGGPVGRLVEQVAGRTVARNMRVSLLALRRMLDEHFAG